MKISEIIETMNKMYDKDSLIYHDYEIISCDDVFGIAIVNDKSFKTCVYQIVIPDCNLSCSYYGVKTVRSFFEKEMAENAYKALVAR